MIANRYTFNIKKLYEFIFAVMIPDVIVRWGQRTKKTNPTSPPEKRGSIVICSYMAPYAKDLAVVPVI